MSGSYRASALRRDGWYLGENSSTSAMCISSGSSHSALCSGGASLSYSQSDRRCLLFVTYSLMTRHIEGFSVYLNYAFIVASPGLVFFWLKGSRRFDALRLAVLGFAAATILCSTRTSCASTSAAISAPRAWQRAGPSTRPRSMRRSSRPSRRTAATPHGDPLEVAYWYLIAPYKEGRYSVASPHLPDPGGLNIFSFQKLPVYSYVPIRIPESARRD